MNEWMMMAYVTLSSLFFAVGGTGFKWVRRFLLPALTFGYLYYAGTNYIIALLVSGMLCAGLHLGYGEGRSYLVRALVGFSWVAPAFILGQWVFPILTPIIWVFLFSLSNQDLTERQVPWKAVELTAGLLIGITYGVSV